MRPETTPSTTPRRAPKGIGSRPVWAAACLAAGVLALAPRDGIAQQNVPRARPLPPTSSSGPAWLRDARVRGEVPPRATTPPRAATPPRALPVPVPPVQVAPPVERSPAGVPRKPSTPDEEKINWANLYYSQKQFTEASKEYRDYLRLYRTKPGAQAAWFRLGECYLRMKAVSQAEVAYQSLLKQFRSGDFVSPAAYRLASLRYNSGNFKDALSYFTISEAKAKNNQLRVSSLYYRGRCLDLVGRRTESAAIYEQLVSHKKDNPYLDVAVLSLGRMSLEDGQKKAAYRHFSQLADQSKNPEILGEALVKAGLLASEFGEAEKSTAFLGRAMELKGSPENLAAAQFGLITTYYNAKEYDKVVDAYRKGTFKLPLDSRRKMLLMAANSYHQIGQETEAQRLFAALAKHYRDTLEGQEAAYRELLYLYKDGDVLFPEKVDEYIDTQKSIKGETRHLDLARLMKAESHFKKQRYDQAAKAYVEVNINNIPESFQPSALYNLGWSEAQSRDFSAAIQAFTQFIEGFKDHALVPAALTQRGVCFRKKGDFEMAKLDFASVIEKYGDTTPVELSLQQKALTHGEAGEYKELIGTFTQLLKQFPESAAAAEANYWIGWGHFELEEYKEAVPFMEAARKLGGETYRDKASLRIILCYYYLEDAKSLSEEIDASLAAQPALQIPASVLGWLGQRYYATGEFQKAKRYLNMAVTPDKPSQTQPVIWHFHGKTCYALNEFDMALASFDRYLGTCTDPRTRARALLEKSRAQLGLKEFDKATESVKEAWGLQKEGRVNAQIRMMKGDLAAAQGNHKEAADAYWLVSEIFSDPDITPQALAKAAAAYEKAGQKKDAEEARRLLEEKYPKFTSKSTESKT